MSCDNRDVWDRVDEAYDQACDRKRVLEKDFPVESNVLYIPYHAKGDANHPDCKRGVVKNYSSSGRVIWVMFPHRHGNQLISCDGCALKRV